MRERIEHEIEVIKAEILPIVGILFENGGNAIEGEDGLEEIEMPGEEDEGLKL